MVCLFPTNCNLRNVLYQLHEETALVSLFGNDFVAMRERGRVVHVKLRKKHSWTVWQAAVEQVQSESRGSWQSVGRKWDMSHGGHHSPPLKQPDSSSSFEGPSKFRRRGQRTESSEEEFFCLTPDDPKQSRSRNASSSSSQQQQCQKFQSASSSSSSHAVPDSKIFSVAVEASRLTSKIDSMKVCDLDTGFSGQFAVVSKSKEEEDVAPVVEPAAESKAVKKSKKKKSKEKKAEESLKAAKTRVIESPPKELLVDLGSVQQ